MRLANSQRRRRRRRRFLAKWFQASYSIASLQSSLLIDLLSTGITICITQYPFVRSIQLSARQQACRVFQTIHRKQTKWSACVNSRDAAFERVSEFWTKTGRKPKQLFWSHFSSYFTLWQEKSIKRCWNVFYFVIYLALLHYIYGICSEKRKTTICNAKYT